MNDTRTNELHEKYQAFVEMLMRFVQRLDYYSQICANPNQESRDISKPAILHYGKLIQKFDELEMSLQISLWEPRIIAAESTSNNLVEFEIPVLGNDKQSDLPLTVIQATSHGYAVTLFNIVSAFLLDGCWEQISEFCEIDRYLDPDNPEYAELANTLIARLGAISFNDSQTLARVAVRIYREKILCLSQIGSSQTDHHDNQSKSIESRTQAFRPANPNLYAPDKVELLLSILVDHHKPLDGQDCWDSRPLISEEIKELGNFGSSTRVSNAFEALFGPDRRQKYERLIREGKLRDFLIKARGESLLGHIQFDETM